MSLLAVCLIYGGVWALGLVPSAVLFSYMERRAAQRHLSLWDMGPPPGFCVLWPIIVPGLFGVGAVALGIRLCRRLREAT